jgi:DNA-binding NtrC family response regulator
VFLEEFRKERGKAIEGFADGVLEAFDAHSWPGNVRELRNVIERAVLFCQGGLIRPEDLPAQFGGAAGSAGRRPAPSPVLTLQQAVEHAEVEAIRVALAATRGRRTEAADKLGVSRKTLWEKIKHYGLSAGE